MKRAIFFLTFLTASLYAQSPELLKEGYVKLYEATEKLDFEAIMDASYPKMIEMAGREALIAEMKKAFSDPTIKISFGKTEFKPEYSEIMEIQGRRFCVIRRQTIMKLTFKQPLTEPQAKTIEVNIARSNPLRTVRFDAKDNTFYSTGPDVTIAVSDALTKKQWRFMTYDPTQEFLIESWFGKETLAELPLRQAAKAAPPDNKARLITAVTNLKAECAKPDLSKAAAHIVYTGPDEDRKYKSPVNYQAAEEKKAVSSICDRIQRRIGEIKTWGEVQTRPKRQQTWHAISFRHTIGDKEKENLFAFVEIDGKLYLGDID